jgi:hypothetical protein
VSPRAGVDAVVKRKIPRTRRESDHRTPLDYYYYYYYYYHHHHHHYYYYYYYFFKKAQSFADLWPTLMGF